MGWIFAWFSDCSFVGIETLSVNGNDIYGRLLASYADGPCTQALAPFRWKQDFSNIFGWRYQYDSLVNV
jgi:hypothetical protein